MTKRNNIDVSVRYRKLITFFLQIGGTNITIRGINLGKEFLDIYGGITVAGIQCDPYESLYLKTEQIVCKVDGPGTKEPRKGPVIVKVADFRGESRDNYEFVDPQIRAIRPKKGPQSGKSTSTLYCFFIWNDNCIVRCIVKRFLTARYHQLV